MTTETGCTKEENERQYRVLDQMLTMHASFRDRLERFAFWLNTGLIALSLFLTVFAFVGDSLLQALGFDAQTTRFVLGILAVLVLICSITEFRVDWRAIAGKHAEAASRLARLKARYRESFVETDGQDVKRNRRLTSQYEQTMDSLPPIPERSFNKLKAEHQFKRLLSERISQHPKTPIWLLRLHMRLEGSGEVLRLRKENDDGESKHENGSA